MKLNNKGFAITAVLYGLLILFVVLVSSYLVVLAAKKERIDYLFNEIESEYSDNSSLGGYIKQLYKRAGKTEVTSGYGKKYNYASAVNLMNDRIGGTISSDNGNLRYYGSNPNNYMYFNCDNYSNQNSSTCELWRIIGVFDEYVKIIRNESIGTYSWDYDQYGTFDNNWHESSLNELLNDGYYNNLDGVTYYNKSTTPTTINFKQNKIGIKNEETRNLISTHEWILGGHNTSSSSYPEQIYRYERETNKCSNCSYFVIYSGKIALMYPSDYGFATDFTKCKNTLYYYNNDKCKTNDWLYLNKSQWLLTPYSENNQNVWWITNTGVVGTTGSANYVEVKREIKPTLYLKKCVNRLSGKGTQSDPYKILVQKCQGDDYDE